MEVSNASIPVSPTSAPIPTTGTGPSQGSSKATGKSSAFGSLLQGASTDTTGPTDDSKKLATDPLQTMLAALSNGLSPLLFVLPGPLQNANPLPTAGGDGQTLSLTIGNQALQVNLSQLPMTNGDLAGLLQKFGASPALMRVLLEQPQGQISASISSHPEVLADLQKALNNVTQQITQTPELMANPKMAELLQSIVTQANSQQSSSGDSNQPNQQQQNLLGKLQASISTHTVENDSSAPAKTGTDKVTTTTQPSVTNMNQLVLGAPLPMPLQSLNQNAHVEPVVYLQADQFKTEFSDLMVKRATLIESPGQQEFRIVLQPQGMGEIEVRVQAVGNQISMHFTADNAASKGMLDSGLANLKNQLQAQGIQFDRIEVTTAQPNNGSAFSGMPQERGSSQNFQGQQGNQSSAKRGNETFSIDAINEIAPEEASLEAEGIDVTA